MDLITLDFETYYDKDFSLRKLTTEEYIRSLEFEVIGVGVKVNNGPTEWASGTHEQMKRYLDGFDWENSSLLCHNTMFDGAILNWIYDIRPCVYLDTLCIARAVHGVEVGGSLKALAKRYGIGEKGTAVTDAIGVHRWEFTDEALDLYGDYCVNDVELTYELFGLMGNAFPRTELKIIDLTLKMFIQPILELDVPLLEEHLKDTKKLKEQLLEDVGVTKKDLMSNAKFAGLLENLGVMVPMKVSPTTGKDTFALAKTDQGFIDLLDHEDVMVHMLAHARLGNKSTLEETRTQRFISIAERGEQGKAWLPVPIKYYAAHTGRFGGDDKINLQNLPSRGVNGKKLKRSMIAPQGHVIIDCDSSQIEARVLSWLAGQDDLVQAFTNGEDVYKQMAAIIYGIAVEDVTKDQRFVGKTTILGCGYGMGANRFVDQLKTFNFEMDIDEARRVIKVYRETYFHIVRLWSDAGFTIKNLVDGNATEVGREGVLKVCPELSAIKLPSGLLMRYDDLQCNAVEAESERPEYTYKTRKGRTRIYGGKLIENVCQAIARCVIAEQMLKISKQYKVVLTVHDSVACCVPEEQEEEARAYMEECMRWLPVWADGLPIDCESGTGQAYGDCE
tara:strand:- start:2020 stop:3870 length:1851 start_codon:yes stop_codon:yes gene_type:complete